MANPKKWNITPTITVRLSEQMRERLRALMEQMEQDGEFNDLLLPVKPSLSHVIRLCLNRGIDVIQSERTRKTVTAQKKNSSNVGRTVSLFDNQDEQETPKPKRRTTVSSSSLPPLVDMTEKYIDAKLPDNTFKAAVKEEILELLSQGYNQVAISKATGISQPTVSKWARGI